ncbi:MAG: AbrB/MazE/SpoVT family DNA-binding domain-containing protein [Cyanobacteria bacterium]|jgi:putative addiction module antidote|nr:AbrB/MazE/SpoVT family DNA-binding domain-containing protein [Cyanobacteria bacterium GSL.Bin21]
MQKLTIRRVGNSLGTTFPKEILDKLNVSQGDSLFVVETPNGIELTPYDPEFEKAMVMYAEGSKKYRNALRELA